VLAVGARLGGARGAAAGTAAVAPGWPAGVVVVLALAVPLAILTCDRAKSAVVGDILVPPLLWALLLPLARLWPLLPGWAGRWVPRGLALAALACGLSVYAGEMCVRLPHGSARPDGKQIADLQDTLIREAERRDFGRPVVCLDVLREYLCPDALNVVAAERFGRVADFGLAPNTGLMQEPTAAQLEAMVRASQFVIVSDGLRDPGSSVLPYDRRLDELRPALRGWCEQHLRLLGCYTVVDRQLLLYARPRALVRGGTTDGWVTSNGLRLRGVGGDLRSFPTITLRGVWSPRWHRAAPNVRALGTGYGAGEVGCARMEVSAGRYEITVKVNPSLLADNPDQEMHLLFDRFFVPRDRGINPDPRQLVVFLPDEVVVSR
jgi:hypothetical protein